MPCRRPTGLALLALAPALLVACDVDGGTGAEPGGLADVAVFDAPPDAPVAPRAEGTCAWTEAVGIEQVGFVRVGHLWTYAADRPVRHRVGQDGVELYEELWTYDASGHLESFERIHHLPSAALPPELAEHWRWEGDLPIAFEQDLRRDGRIDRAWRWRWDAQGHLIAAEANLDGLEGLDYREEIAWVAHPTRPDHRLERTRFDLDGDGTFDVTLERHFDAEGRVYRAERIGPFGGVTRRVETAIYDPELAFDSTRETAWLGPSMAILRSASQPLVASSYPDGRTRGHGGDHEVCFIDAEGQVLAFGVDTDHAEPLEVEYLPPSPPQRSAPLYDARGNVHFASSHHYDPGFVGFRCGEGVAVPPRFPTRVPLTEGAYGIDPLCEPRFLACRELAPWRIVRCPQY